MNDLALHKMVVSPTSPPRDMLAELQRLRDENAVLRTLSKHPDGHLRAAEVLRIVCAATGLTYVQLKSRRKVPVLCTARRMALVILRAHCGLPYETCARLLGRLDHTSAYHALEQFSKRESVPLRDRAAMKLRAGALFEELRARALRGDVEPADLRSQDERAHDNGQARRALWRKAKEERDARAALRAEQRRLGIYAPDNAKTLRIRDRRGRWTSVAVLSGAQKA